MPHSSHSPNSVLLFSPPCHIELPLLPSSILTDYLHSQKRPFGLAVEQQRVLDGEFRTSKHFKHNTWKLCILVHLKKPEENETSLSAGKIEP